MLQSFRRLQVALGMYERMGFVPMPPPPEMRVLARTEMSWECRWAGRRDRAW